MRALPEQQAAFGAALLSGGDAAFFGAFVEPPAVAEKRFAAYRRNVLGNWQAALAASYPVLATVVGAGRFAALADTYRHHEPSRDADLNRYGEGFPDFLAVQPIARELPYLPDLARLERAIEAAERMAADLPGFDFAALAALDPERQGELGLRLSAALADLACGWPVVDIWSAHQLADEAERDAALAAIDLRPAPHWVVIARAPAGAILPVRLSAGESEFLAACRAGESLDRALSRAVAVEPGLAVGALLPNWLARGWLAGFTLPEGD